MADHPSRRFDVWLTVTCVVVAIGAALTHTWWTLVAMTLTVLAPLYRLLRAKRAQSPDVEDTA